MGAIISRSSLVRCAVVFVVVFLGFTGSAISRDKVFAATDTEKFHQLLSRYTHTYKRLDAFLAPYYEVEEKLGSFGDSLTKSSLRRSRKLYERTLSRLNEIDVSKLSDDDQTTYSILKSDLKVRLEGEKFPSRYMSVHFRGSRLLSFIDETSPKLTSFPFDSTVHYKAFLTKVDGLASYVDRLIYTLTEGVHRGYVLNCEVARKTTGTLRSALINDVERNPFFRPVLSFPSSISSEDQNFLKTEFSKAITHQIIPAYTKFINFFEAEYLPRCRESYGYGSLPNGKRWYEYTIRQRTDLALSPRDLHNLGLSEVARIKAQIDGIALRMGFSGSTQEFMQYMLTNPTYHFSTQEQIRASFESVRQRIAPKIAEFFVTVPRSDYVIIPSENPNAVGASYQAPTNSVPYGRFIFNGLNPSATNVYDVTTLSMHEAIPGHHFHLALAYENMNRLSEYQRKIFLSTAFNEGWALYAESLGDAMEMFTDPVQKFGNLNYELLRAVRLVVDTGIHYKGWSRQRTIRYMKANIAKNDAYIEGEADRYAVYPGQALSYKVGELKIRELREIARTRLGSKFDIRKFHEIVLSTGTLPLPVLEEKVRAWIK